jgi:hypothetical protein
MCLTCYFVLADETWMRTADVVLCCVVLCCVVLCCVVLCVFCRLCIGSCVPV